MTLAKIRAALEYYTDQRKVCVAKSAFEQYEPSTWKQNGLDGGAKATEALALLDEIMGEVPVGLPAGELTAAVTSPAIHDPYCIHGNMPDEQCPKCFESLQRCEISVIEAERIQRRIYSCLPLSIPGAEADALAKLIYEALTPYLRQPVSLVECADEVQACIMNAVNPELPAGQIKIAKAVLDKAGVPYGD